MKRKAPTIIGILLVGAFWVRGDEIVWTQNFEFSKLPFELNVGWKPHAGEGRIENGRLVIDSEDKEYMGWYFNREAIERAWDGRNPTTVEFRMRVPEVYDDAAGGGASIILGDGTRTYRFSFRNPEMRTYRITLRDGVAVLYHLENPERPPIFREGRPNYRGSSGGNISPNSISFGPLASNVKGVSEWEFLRWTNETAQEP